MSSRKERHALVGTLRSESVSMAVNGSTPAAYTVGTSYPLHRIGRQSSLIDMKAKKAIQKTDLPEAQFHAIGRALADPRRFAILQQIAADDGMTCSDLNAHNVISPATISHHLKELNEAGLVRMEREGRFARLFLMRDAWKAYLQRLSAL